MNPCCCCTLRTGGMIIAILELVGGIIGILISGIGIAGVVALQHMTTGIINSTNSSLTFQLHDRQDSTTSNHNIMDIHTSGNLDHSAGEILLVILSLIIILSLAQILFAALLLHGIQKKSVQLIKMWIIFKIIGIMFSIGFVISSFVAPSLTNGPSIYDGVSIAFSFYFVWVGVALMQETRTQTTTRIKPTNY